MKAPHPRAAGDGSESPASIELFCRRDGRIEAIYSEAIDLTRLGQAAIRRASHVEPDEAARWWADMRPSGGGRLGPFACRSAALAAERDWLLAKLAAAMPERPIGQSANQPADELIRVPSWAPHEREMCVLFFHHSRRSP
jgi:hypothetical protein